MNNDRMTTRLGCTAIIVLYAMAISMAIWLLTGCTSVRYVPVETVRTDSVRIVTVRTDSIHVADSTVIDRGGDTIRIERWRTAWRDRLRIDTLWRIERDSIQVPYPVERPLSRWQRFKMDYGGMAIGVTIGAIVLAALCLIRKFL